MGESTEDRPTATANADGADPVPAAAMIGEATVDIHKPKPVHSWREFFGEIGVIVIGVLIALGAEQVVEAMHWHEKIDRAEDAMRIELSQDDGPQAYARLLIGRCLDQRIIRIHDQAGTAPPDQLRQWIAGYAPPFRVWDSEAWKLVVAGDTGSHMASDRAIAWSAPYRIVPNITETAVEEQRLLVELNNALPPSGAPSADDLHTLRLASDQLHMLNRRMIASSRLFLARIRDNGADLRPADRAELIRRAQALYGSCISVPDPNARPPADQLSANLISASTKE